MPIGEKQSYRFGPFELDALCGQVRRDGVGLKLQGQPVQILEILLEKPGQLVTREELRERLWSSDTFVDFDHSLNTAVKKLRQALGDEADTPRYIETLPRRGYRYIGELPSNGNQKRNSGTEPQADDDMISKAATALAEASISATDSKRRAHRPLWIGITSASLLALAAAAYWITKPAPMPRIVNAHALTRTGFQKAAGKLVTDGVSVYFQENRPSGLVTLQVHINGGEPSEVAVSKVEDASLQDISPDGSQLLLSTANSQTGAYDGWIQPLPAGPARLILKDARFPIWTPDGKSILFARNLDRDLYRANADGTDARRLATLPDITLLEISPDGRRIRFDVDPKYDLWEAGADGSDAHPTLPGYQGWVFGKWSPNGKYFFFSNGGDRRDLWAMPEKRHWWQRNTSRPTALTFGPMSIRVPTVSKDGRQLFAVAEEWHGELSIFDKKTGQFVPYLNGIPACYADFSRDGKWMAYVSYPEGNLWRSRADGTERMQLTSPPLAVINPRWSPDGKLIVFTDLSNGDRSKMSHGGVHRIYVVSVDGGAPILLLADRVGDPTWSPDGQAIAYSYNSSSSATSEVRILDLQTQKSTTVPGSRGFWSPRWSPDGKYLAALGGGVAHWNLGLFSYATQKWETPIKGALNWPAWSHDSKFLYALNEESSLVRFSVADRRVEQVISLKGFHSTAYYYGGWYGLTPDDRPIATRDTGTQEIYAFDLEYK